MGDNSKALEKRIEAPEAFINRELSWLQFANKVLELAADPEVPLLERVKFIGILGMLHDEFFMKRISGLKRQVANGVKKLSLDGLRPDQELAACRKEILHQITRLGQILETEIRPALTDAGIPLLDIGDLDEKERARLSEYFADAILPTLTPLAVDAEHPFPFIANLGLNLAVRVGKGAKKLFVRIKVPENRPRWVPVRKGGAHVPLEQVIADNLDQLFPAVKSVKSFAFRVTRGAEGDEQRGETDVEDTEHSSVPGSIISQVTSELKARRFAGVVRLQVDAKMPKGMVRWLTEQLELGDDDVYTAESLLARADLLSFDIPERSDLRNPPHTPVVHPRLRGLNHQRNGQIFDEIRRGDIVLHHPYHCFDSSVVAFLESAAIDDKVLAIKLTIYRTSTDSPIVLALAEAARRGKEVAVLVEITARFDEAPNIAWGRLLENEGVHVSYGVEKLKTHVKLAMVVREETDGIRRYVHVGTGNYHSGTARVYEDLGVLSCDRALSSDVAVVFNELTSSMPSAGYKKMLVAPRHMRKRFMELIRREAEHARAGRSCGIRAKMNQLQDPAIIRELYKASCAGVPISVNVRGLCCLRPGVPDLSENIRVYSVLGRFLEHARVYRFENDGAPELFLGSADWMKRNLDNRVETIMPVTDSQVQAEIDAMFDILEADNSTAWDLLPDGSYERRRPSKGEQARPAQICFQHLVSES